MSFKGVKLLVINTLTVIS